MAEETPRAPLGMAEPQWLVARVRTADGTKDVLSEALLECRADSVIGYFVGDVEVEVLHRLLLFGGFGSSRGVIASQVRVDPGWIVRIRDERGVEWPVSLHQVCVDGLQALVLPSGYWAD